MTDHTELIKALRHCGDTEIDGCVGCELREPDMTCAQLLMTQAADAIEELQRINIAMKPKYDLVCVKCAYYAEAKHNKKGFLICPASGMDITAWDFCSYFEPQPPKEET